jgi:hypothetical protein
LLSLLILIDTDVPFLADGTSRWLFSMLVTRPTSSVNAGTHSIVPTWKSIKMGPRAL